MKRTSNMFKGLLGGGLVFFLVVTLLGQAAAQTWTELLPTGELPHPRNIHTSVYDAAANRMTVFGGLAGFAGTGPLFNDV